MFAEFDSHQTVPTALIGGVVVVVLFFIVQSTRNESVKFAESKTVAYSKAMRVVVICIWLLVVAILALAIGVMLQHGDLTAAAALLGSFAALNLILHLEVFGVSITWDETNIYTRSPWRKQRTIPFSAVEFCDYSPIWQWYRVHTKGHGIIRVHQYMRGMHKFLRALPCATPAGI